MNDMINKSEFILGVDGGGTKTIARLENLHTGQQWLATGGSASLTNDFDLALQDLIFVMQGQTDKKRKLSIDVDSLLNPETIN